MIICLLLNNYFILYKYYVVKILGTRCQRFLYLLLRYIFQRLKTLAFILKTVPRDRMGVEMGGERFRTLTS